MCLRNDKGASALWYTKTVTSFCFCNITYTFARDSSPWLFARLPVKGGVTVPTNDIGVTIFWIARKEDDIYPFEVFICRFCTNTVNVDIYRFAGGLIPHDRHKAIQEAVFRQKIPLLMPCFVFLDILEFTFKTICICLTTVMNHPANIEKNHRHIIFFHCSSSQRG